MFRKSLVFLISTISMTQAIAQSEMSVLFIGNSFTFMNDMPFTFQKMADSAGHSIFVDTIVEGGKDLKYHCAQAETFEKISSRKWDYVVIQCSSWELAAPNDKIEQTTTPFAKKLIDSVRANSNCTNVIFYMTWGYKFGNNNWTPIASYETMQEKIRGNYMAIGQKFDAIISPVGVVWKKMRESNTAINLYDPDLRHPSAIGSYISACTFFSVIFGESPIGNTELGGITAEDALRIQGLASETVLDNLSTWNLRHEDLNFRSGFDIQQKGCELKLNCTAVGATNVEYSFGDGNSSTQIDPSHIYEAIGEFTITQKVISGCKSRILQRTIKID